MKRQPDRSKEKLPKAVKPTAKAREKTASPYSPKTAEEKAEAFRLLDELLKGLARQNTLREVVAASLPETKTRRS